MRSRILLVLAACVAAWIPARGQGPNGGESREPVSTAIPGVIAAGQRFTQIFQTVGNNVDGVVAAADGSLLASQEDNNAVLRIDKDDRASVYLAGVAVGSLSIDRQGRLFAVRRIPGANNPAATHESAARTAGVTLLLPERKMWDTLADGTTMMGRPSDLCADGTGGAYFTHQEQGVFYAASNGTITKASEHRNGNGIILSEDDKRLYVTNEGSIVVFDVQGPGRLTNQREFVKLPSGRADGLAVDTRGNLYVAAEPGVQVFTRDGAPLGVIRTPTSGRPTGQAFAGADRKTLYAVVSATTDENGNRMGGRTVYRIPMLAQGLPGRGK